MSATSAARRQPTTNDNSNSNSSSKQRRISKRQQQQTTTTTTTKQPVFYSSADTTFGFTTIKDISGAGFFTVHAAPYIKNEICHANKYIKKVSLEQIRNALVGMRVPPNEEFL